MEMMMIALDLDIELLFAVEIMFEILSWLPVTSLLRCKCVCKRWNEIIEDPKFIVMHMERSKENVTYYDSKTFDILDSGFGLLVEKNNISGTYRVRNSATKQILALPDPKEEPIYMLIVPLASINSYKLVCVYLTENGNAGFKVLSFEGSDLSWRSLANSYFYELDRRSQRRLSFLVNSGFLFITALYEDGSCDAQIHCLDVETEIFTYSPIIVPRSFFNNWEKVVLGLWSDHNKLAVMNIVEEDLHVWVLEDNITRKWAETRIIILLTFLKENPDMKEKLTPFWASHEEILFTKDYFNIINYNIRSKRVWKSENSAPPGKKIIATGFRTLVKLKGMQPEKLPDKKQHSDEVERISLFKFVSAQMDWITYTGILLILILKLILFVIG